MNHETFEQAAGGLTGVCVSALGITTSDLYNWVGIVCSIIGLLITIVTTVVIPFIKKLKQAKENDGKIDSDELKDALDDLKNNIDNIDKGEKK